MRSTRGPRSHFHAFLAALLPFPCLACGALLPFPADPLGLCPDCRARLRAPSPEACRRCGRPSLAPASRADRVCGPCLLRPPPFDELVHALVYEPPLTNVVQALKFRGMERLARGLADEILARAPERLRAADLVVPMPLNWFRRLGRGYNQAESLARPLADSLGLTLAPWLHRRLRPRQARLSRQSRLANLQGSFRCRPGIAGRAVLLVDDVTTTGATLAAASRCLRRAGATRVVAVVAARTPRRGEPHPSGEV